MTVLFIDADACPVKDEVYAVAARCGLVVVVVANQRIYVPHDLGVEMVVVPDGPDAADDWIATGTAYLSTCSATSATELLAQTATTRKRSEWRAMTDRVARPMEPVDPNMATLVTAIGGS